MPEIQGLSFALMGQARPCYQYLQLQLKKKVGGVVLPDESADVLKSNQTYKMYSITLTEFLKMHDLWYITQAPPANIRLT